LEGRRMFLGGLAGLWAGLWLVFSQQLVAGHHLWPVESLCAQLSSRADICCHFMYIHSSCNLLLDFVHTHTFGFTRSTSHQPAACSACKATCRWPANE
jgi:hypothetical protein